MLSIACGAQVMEKYPGMQYSRMSNNGRYLVSSATGLVIYDRESKKTYNYGTAYSPGTGNMISDTGIAVASGGNFTKPSYWQSGEWHDLPHNIGNTSIAMANGITPDGKLIVGSLDCRPLTKKAWPMVSPVIWTFDEATGTYVFEMLPAPKKDITGCIPQQVSATYISSDGKTILGQVTDQRGFMEYQIIYRQAEDGKWDYETSGGNRLEKENAVWPPYPERPVKPQAADYLTDNEKLAFNNANQAYLDSLEIVSLTGIKPRMPFYEDFIKERKTEYDDNMKKYEQDNDSYLTNLYAFFDAYTANITNHRFEFNSHRLSNNGEYYACNYIYPDPAAQAGDKNVKMFISPIMYNLKSGDEPQMTQDVSLGVFSICDDGTITVASPRSDVGICSRVPYIITPGDTPIEYTEWLKSQSTPAYAWLEENMTYDVAEEGQNASPTLLAGTVRLSPDATKILSYCLDPDTNQDISYFIDLTAAPTSIEMHPTHCLSAHFNSQTQMLDITGTPTRIDIYDLSGRHIYGIDKPCTSINVKEHVGTGVYVVRLTADTETVSVKIVI